jgi:hypothetical protein
VPVQQDQNHDPTVVSACDVLLMAIIEGAKAILTLFQVPTMAFFDCDGVRLMLGLPETPLTEHTASVIYFQVDEIFTAFDCLKRRGVAFEEDPHLIARMEGHEL